MKFLFLHISVITIACGTVSTTVLKSEKNFEQVECVQQELQFYIDCQRGNIADENPQAQEFLSMSFSDQLHEMLSLRHQLRQLQHPQKKEKSMELSENMQSASESKEEYFEEQEEKNQSELLNTASEQVWEEGISSSVSSDEDIIDLLNWDEEDMFSGNTKQLKDYVLSYRKENLK